MTDGEMIAAIAAAVTPAIGGLGLTFRWGVNRIVRALDKNSDSNAEQAKAAITSASAMTALSVKIDRVDAWITTRSPLTEETAADLVQKVDEVHDWAERALTPVEDPTATESPRAQALAKIRSAKTPAGGVRIARPGTHHDR